MPMKKIPYKVAAALKTATKDEIQEIAIHGEKGIPMITPDGLKTFIVSIDNAGNIITTEVI